MAAIEFWNGPTTQRRYALEGASCSIGSDPDSVDIHIADATVSRLHAVIDRIGTAWLIRDLGSRNGTRVNGEILGGQHRLRDGEEIVVGRTRFVFRDDIDTRGRKTDALAGPPKNITRAERLVLIELCRPLLSHHAFQPPASVREIAARLHTGKNAVQAHLVSLYDKFGLYGDDRRVQLANEAIERGAVTLDDLRDDDDGKDRRG